jgi:hypothetical protein
VFSLCRFSLPVGLRFPFRRRTRRRGKTCVMLTSRQAGMSACQFTPFPFTSQFFFLTAAWVASHAFPSIPFCSPAGRHVSTLPLDKQVRLSIHSHLFHSWPFIASFHRSACLFTPVLFTPRRRGKTCVHPAFSFPTPSFVLFRPSDPLADSHLSMYTLPLHFTPPIHTSSLFTPAGLSSLLQHPLFSPLALTTEGPSSILFSISAGPPLPVHSFLIRIPSLSHPLFTPLLFTPTGKRGRSLLHLFSIRDDMEGVPGGPSPTAPSVLLQSLRATHSHPFLLFTPLFSPCYL